MKNLQAFTIDKCLMTVLYGVNRELHNGYSRRGAKISQERYFGRTTKGGFGFFGKII